METTGDQPSVAIAKSKSTINPNVKYSSGSSTAKRFGKYSRIKVVDGGL